MILIKQWANNIKATKPINGSWIESIARAYNVTLTNNNILLDIAIRLRADTTRANLYQAIAIKLSNNANIKPLNGSWLARIVQITTP